MTADLPDAPEVLKTCPECDGAGGIDIPRPFADDPYYCDSRVCDACAGSGFMIEEAEGDPVSGTMELHCYSIAEEACPGHVASHHDAKVCRHSPFDVVRRDGHTVGCALRWRHCRRCSCRRGGPSAPPARAVKTP